MNRNPWFDNIKGFLVIFVVIGHMLTDLRFDYDGKLLETVYLLIYSFHMPLFIILSVISSAKINTYVSSNYLPSTVSGKF